MTKEIITQCFLNLISYTTKMMMVQKFPLHPSGHIRATTMYLNLDLKHRLSLTFI